MVATTEHRGLEGYRRREPETGALHRVLRTHLETFLARAAGDGTRPGLPRFAEREFRRFLACGILAHGFARVRCPRCGLDELVAFSCKGRGFCPSCCARRMSETAAHLVDRVLPEVPVRQWVLTFPFPLRFLLARDPSMTAALRRIFLRVVFAFQERRARDQGVPRGRSGAVCAIQRFGCALNLNPSPAKSSTSSRPPAGPEAPPSRPVRP